jgi:beta-lactam-binding protein with PASTA domain
VPPRDGPARWAPGGRGDHRQRRRRARRRGWLALLLVLALTAAAALTGWYLTEGRVTTAPVLQSLSQPEAQTVAEKAGLTIRFDQDYSENIPAGLVASSDPAAGSRIQRGGEVVAYLSRGPERHPMPALAGLAESGAVAALTRNHLRVGTIRTDYSDTVAKDLVVVAAYPPGRALKPDTPVDLTVSAGPRPVKIIDYSGQDTDQAVAALKQSGFAVTVTTQNSDTVPKGRLISQAPNSGTGVKGDRVSLTSSLGPVLVTVPNVRRMGVSAAEQAMKDAGFRTRVKPVLINYLGLGFVVYTRPGGGSQAPKGTTVTLYVI